MSIIVTTGVGLATAGIANLGDALLQSSSFHDLMGYICYCVEAVYGFHSTLGFFSSFFRENTLGSCAVCGGSKKSR